VKINLTNGTAYLSLSNSAKAKDTLPIDSTVLLLNRLKGPIGFEILQDSDAHEWLDTWQESSPVSFENFIDMMKKSDQLDCLDGCYFLKGNTRGDVSYELDASCYVDFDEHSEVLGLEFLFQGSV
jgi:uncharacterized protein YuzE